MKKYPQSVSQIGRLFIDKNGDVWRMVGFTTSPQATMQKLNSDHQEQHVVGCPNMLNRGWDELIPASEASK